MSSYLVDKWKGVVADFRERGQVPMLQRISDFVRNSTQTLAISNLNLAEVAEEERGFSPPDGPPAKN